MIESKVRGRVVLVTDVESLAFPVGSSGYAGSKCALRGLADSLRYRAMSWSNR
jgi:NAD(P)-dependent dehydrogenase (short-subunit alcohol dehydrogenase family)